MEYVAPARATPVPGSHDIAAAAYDGRRAMNALGGTPLPAGSSAAGDDVVRFVRPRATTAQGHTHLKYARGEPELAHDPAGHIAQCSYNTRAVGARVLHQS